MSLYATLLLPYAETNPNVQPLIEQMLNSNDKQLKYSIMLLLLRNNKSFPDTLPGYFAGLDEYRYDLYKDLKRFGKKDKFPLQYNNHLDLGKSKLVEEKSYGKPDSILYIDRLSAEFRGKKGFIYFFKYKNKKDDLAWKLATVGLVPEDPKVFEFEIDRKPDLSDYFSSYRLKDFYRYDFTGFSETKIKDDEPLSEQLNKTLKKLLYSKRKSAKQFYEKNETSRYDVTSSIDFGD